MTAAYAVGCTPAAPPAPPTPPAPATTSNEDHGDPHAIDGGHGHGAGPHAGTLADWGGGKYHVEFTVDHDQQTATVYVLGSDEKTAAPIKATDGKLLLTITEPSFQVELTADPLEGEADGNASRFVGKDEKLGSCRNSPAQSVARWTAPRMQESSRKSRMALTNTSESCSIHVSTSATLITSPRFWAFNRNRHGRDVRGVSSDA